MHPSIVSSRQATQRTWRALSLFVATAALIASALTLWLFSRAVDSHRRQISLEGERLASGLSHEM